MAKRTTGLRFQSPAGVRPQTVPVGKRQRLRIERLSHDGRGIAFLDGRTWFVSGALPDEEVDVRVLSSRSKIVEARAERWFSSHPERRALACRHAAQCGGCSVQHLAAEQQLQLKQQALAEQLNRAGLKPQTWAAPLSGPEWGYRRRARLAVRWDVNNHRLNMGFRAAASQDIIPIHECPVLVPELQRLLDPLHHLLATLERPKALGHLELFSGTECAVLVRLTAAVPEADQSRWLQFARDQQVQLWFQTATGEPELILGQPTLGYALQQWDLVLGYRPGDFVQVNAWVNERMVAQALDWLAVQPDESVLDLFCGLGNFALPLARQTRAVCGVEGVANMVEQARTNAVQNGLPWVDIRQADLANPEWSGPLQLGRGNLAAVLLDPPREGALAVVQQLGSLGAQRILYVSCNPATLARDAAALQAQGYCLKRVGILDMFPQTAHVEAMALFERT